MKKIVFFDRDGTLIVDKIYLNDPEAIEYLPGVFDGLAKLSKAGFEFVVVTNQSGVPRGLVQVENLDQIHANMTRDFAEKGISILKYDYAPYLVESGHPKRKPGTGMLDEAMEDYPTDTSKSWMVGDRMTDVEAGHRAGVKSIFLHGTENPRESDFSPAEKDAKTFSEVVDFILENTQS